MRLGKQAYRPVFEADGDARWERLQSVLTGPFTEFLRQYPSAAENEGSGESPKALEHYARSLASSVDELAKLLHEGAASVRRRNKLIARRGSSLDDNTLAAMSHTAASGFAWAILFVGLSGFYGAQGLVQPGNNDEQWRFVRYVIERGGADQYRLLRAAELAKLDEEQQPHLVEEGELSDEARQLEQQAHRAWLDLQ